jgi:FPC/CPF motif-containing protein YcgG
MLLPCGVATAFSAEQLRLTVAMRLRRLSVAVRLTNLISRHRTDLSKTDKFCSAALAQTAPCALFSRLLIKRFGSPLAEDFATGENVALQQDLIVASVSHDLVGATLRIR